MATPNNTGAGDPGHGIVIRRFNPAPDSWDEVAVSRICEITAPPFLRNVLTPSPSAPFPPYLWALPYVRLSPSSCFVLDASDFIPTSSSPPSSPSPPTDHATHALASPAAAADYTAGLIPTSCVGYVIAAPNTAAFVDAYEEKYIPSLPSTWVAPPGPPLAWSGATLPGALLQTLHDPSAMLQPSFPALLEEYPAHLHIDILPPYQSRGFGSKMIARLEEELKAQGAKGVHLVMDGGNRRAVGFYERCGFGRLEVVMDGGASGEVGRRGDGCLVLVKKLV